MIGFYVVLLVLVAGSVPSHGRTESEGTVFNKPQHHESMSNVTVSSSKVETYHCLYLALQWPMSYCMDLETNHHGQCIRPVPNRFTVHGLWPHTSSRVFVDCRSYPSYPRLNYNNLVRGLNVHNLGLYWPDLKGNNQRFWEDEYNKHGSCTFNNQVWYFSHTLALAQLFENPMLQLIRNVPGIGEGRPTSPRVIRAFVNRFTSLWPSLKCIRVGQHELLLEIRFCLAGQRNCPPYIDCGNRVFIPLPPVHP